MSFQNEPAASVAQALGLCSMVVPDSAAMEGSWRALALESRHSTDGSRCSLHKVSLFQNCILAPDMTLSGRLF